LNKQVWNLDADGVTLEAVISESCGGAPEPTKGEMLRVAVSTPSQAVI